jgi:hypothetical protein
MPGVNGCTGTFGGTLVGIFRTVKSTAAKKDPPVVTYATSAAVSAPFTVASEETDAAVALARARVAQFNGDVMAAVRHQGELLMQLYEARTAETAAAWATVAAAARSAEIEAAWATVAAVSAALVKATAED